jgi:hypothetical protein
MTPSINSTRSAGHAKATNVLLWAAQGLLAGLFLFAGVAKLAMPLAPVARQLGLPVVLLRGVAVAELLGAMGLILPGVLRIRPALTPIAAACLAGIMAGATVLTALTQGIGPAVFPFVVGILLTAVVRGRQSWAQGPRPSRRQVSASNVDGPAARRAA